MEKRKLEGSFLGPYRVYERSVQKRGGSTFALVRRSEGEKLLFVSKSRRGEFHGEECPAGGLLCPLSPENAFALARTFAWLKPRPVGVKKPSFGFGDRLGLATSGHVRAVRNQGVFPVLAQQSIREMIRTGRTPEEVMATAIWGAFQEGYKEGFGADADHLKTTDDVKRTAPLGFTMFTYDPSDHVVDRAATMPLDELHETFAALESSKDLYRRYAGQLFTLDDPEGGNRLEVTFSEEELMRAAIKYMQAVDHAVRMFAVVHEHSRVEGFDFELSVDETQVPTTPKEHFFIVSELKRAGVRLTGLAPRFVGEFQKGIDYIGDLDEFKRQLTAHAAISRALGPYKISAHSGSDKFRIYPLLREQLGDLYHVKTAGTSYLEALRLVGIADPSLFREIYCFALDRYSEDKRSYHVTEHPQVPEVDAVPDKELATLLDQNDVRQLLHVTFGSVLSDFRERLLPLLNKHEEEYGMLLEGHFARHLNLLAAKGVAR